MQISNPEHLEPTEMENMPIGTDHNMILVMGVTGSGKSYFINKLSGEGTTRIGNQLSSCEYITTNKV
jgi:predicted GTPase